MKNISSGNSNIIGAEAINHSILNVINKKIDFNCYSSPKGLRELRIQIADFLERNWLYKINYEDMLITSGSQQSINLIADSLLNENNTILIEQPTYFGAIDVFKRKHCRLIGVSINEDGIDIKQLKQKIIKHKPKLIYVVPTFNNPTGIAWTIENRLSFLKLINEYNILVVEDDPYFLISYTKNKHHSLYELNKGHNIIYLGTFSKLISPSINVGYIIAGKEYMNLLYDYKKSYDLCTSSFNQYVVLDYLENNNLNVIVNDKVSKYKAMLKKTIEYLKDKYKGKVSYVIPRGGMFMLAKFDVDIDNKLFDNANDYYIEGGHNHEARINICSKEILDNK